MVVDAANVSEVGQKIGEASAHGAAGRWRIESVRCHPDLLQEARIRILEVNLGQQISPAGECRLPAVVHAKQSGFVAAPIHSPDEVEEICFCAAKRIVVLVAIQYAHSQVPIGECEPEIAPQNREHFARD